MSRSAALPLRVRSMEGLGRTYLRWKETAVYCDCSMSRATFITVSKRGFALGCKGFVQACPKKPRLAGYLGHLSDS